MSGEAIDTRTRSIRRGSGDSTFARKMTQHGRPAPVAAAANSRSRERRNEAGTGGNNGLAHSTNKAGNDRGGKGPKLKGSVQGAAMREANGE